MMIQYKGIRKKNVNLTEFEKYFKELPCQTYFEYMGMTVEIVPYLSFSSGSVLIYWEDISEGFNDKIIFNTFAEFSNVFKVINA